MSNFGMHVPNNGAQCPQGCGNTMMYFQEKQANACRFCQANNQQAIPGGTSAGQNYPTAPSMSPGYTSHPTIPNQQGPLPPNVQIVKQNSAREMYAQTGDPRWLKEAEKQEAAAQRRQLPPTTAPQAQPTRDPSPIEVSAVTADLFAVIGTLVEVVEKLNVIANAFNRVPAPPPMNVAAHTAAGQTALTPEMAAILAQMERLTPVAAQVTTPAASAAPLQPSTAHVGKLKCLVCQIESLGAKADPMLTHTCEKGAANGKTTQDQVPHAPSS